MSVRTNSHILVTIACLCLLALTAAVAQEESAQSFPSIKCEELRKMIEGKAADILVVSTDPQESYQEGHIPGAVSFPWVNTLKAPVALPRNKTLVLYCSCAHEEDSSDMAAKLGRFGYRNIKLLEGGLLKWRELKYPVEKEP
jgi:3-mercaptopyruvate sulfurtransferase SseA